MKVQFIRILNALLIIALLTPIGAVPAGAAPPSQGMTITPGEIRYDLVPETGLETQLTIMTAETPIPKADVFLLFDVTGSMEDVTESEKENASVIASAIRASVPDTQFGVGSFSDLPRLL